MRSEYIQSGQWTALEEDMGPRNCEAIEDASTEHYETGMKGKWGVGTPRTQVGQLGGMGGCASVM